MFCKKCGAPVNEGELFCTACGEKIEAVQPLQDAVQPAPQQPYQPAFQQQPYGAPPYGQPPYGQPYGAPPYGQPPRKTSKALLWAIIGIVAALAIAAVLIFVVLPSGGSNWPFAGNTTQTKFVNDNLRVFADSFSGIGNGDTFARLGKEPFDVKMDVTASVMGQQSSAKIEAAYDKESFGLRFEQNANATVVALLKDVLYSESNGFTTGIRFNTKADLSKPMTLEDRIKAILESLTNKTQTAPTVDFGKVAEMLINSIDEKCFEKSGDKTTLTLNIDDTINTLDTFTKKLQNDKQLLEDLNDYAEKISGTPLDVLSVLKTAVSALEGQKSSLYFSLVWELTYKNGAPVSLKMTFRDNTSEIALAYGYEKSGAKTDVDFSVKSAGVDVATGNINYEKTTDGIKFGGSLTSSGQTLTLDGSEQISGDKTSGKIIVSIPNAGELSVDYDETLKFGMPSTKVADDSRFKVDTQNATVTEAANFVNPFSIAAPMPGLVDPASLLPSDYENGISGSPEVAVVNSNADLDGTLWECEGYQDGDMYVEGQSLYFKDGKVYFGQAGMSGQEVIDSGLSTYGGVDYTFDGATISLTAPDGTSADYYYDGTSVWVGTTEFKLVG